MRDILTQTWEPCKGLHLCKAILGAGPEPLGKYTKFHLGIRQFRLLQALCLSPDMEQLPQSWANCIGAVERLQLQSATHSTHWTSPADSPVCFSMETGQDSLCDPCC